MIIQCPHCRRKNRLPDTPQGKGLYRCSNCQETLVGTRDVRTFLLPEWLRKSAPSKSAPSKSAPRGRRQTAVVLLDLTFLLALLALWLMEAAGPERWWLGSFNLYLPRWLWGLPAVVLVPLTWGLARRQTWMPLGALLWVLGPVMGLCWHWGWPASPGARPSGRSGCG